MTDTQTPATLSAELAKTLASSYDLYFDGSVENGPAVEFDASEHGLTVTGSFEAVSEVLVCIGHAVANYRQYGDELSTVADALGGAVIDLQAGGTVEVYYPNFRLP